MARKMKFYKTGWVLPFIDRRCQFTNLKDNYGCYIIKNAHGRIVYVGVSHVNFDKSGRKTGSLYKTAARHFYPWKDNSQRRFSYPQDGGYKIRFVITTAGRATKLEISLRKFLNPQDNPISPELTQDIPVIRAFDSARFRREIEEMQGIYRAAPSEDLDECPF